MTEFSNLRAVRRLGETPEAYLVTLDRPDGETLTDFCARAGGGALAGAVLAAVAAGQHMGAVTDADPAPPLTAVHSKARMFAAMTDAEYAVFAAALAQQSLRVRAIFENAAELLADDPLFAQLAAAMAAAYGAARAAEILTASRA